MSTIWTAGILVMLLVGDLMIGDRPLGWLKSIARSTLQGTTLIAEVATLVAIAAAQP